MNITDFLPLAVLTAVLSAAATLLGQFIVGRWNKESAEIARHDALRLAALDKRLSALQRAYILWDALVNVIHQQDKGDAVKNCYTFWTENCIYLDKTVREPFRQQILYAGTYAELYRNTPEAQSKWDDIMNVFTLIEDAAGLPPLALSKEEYEKQLEKAAKNKNS